MDGQTVNMGDFLPQIAVRETARARQCEKDLEMW